MGLQLSSGEETMKVILRDDSAIGDGADYDKYLETNEEAHLNLKADDTPTRFVLLKVLPYGLAQKVEDAQMTIQGKAGKDETSVKFNLSYMIEEVRCALTGIENSPTLPKESHIHFDRESDGGASKKLMAQLYAAGYGKDLWTARHNIVAAKVTSRKK